MNLDVKRPSLLLIGCLVFLGGCQPPATVVDQALFDRAIPAWLQEHQVAGVGVAVLRDGALAWTGYYGERGPGVPITDQTVFNTASVAKTVTAETLLALASKGLISLDEPIAGYVTHPDLADDERFELLTPRLLLSHRSGLLNWPYLYPDGVLAFVEEPGKTFSYSGIGIEFAAQYAEEKLGREFEELAFEHLLAPLGIQEMSLGRRKPWLDGRLAIPMDEYGEFVDPGSVPYVYSAPDPADGEWSGADNLLTTVDAYARFLVALFDSSWLSDDLVRQRTEVLTSLEGDAVWNCEPQADVVCATRYGHGLGWMVYEFDDRTTVKHGGNDQGENALVYYSPETRSGAVIFVNGGNGILVTVRILDLLGDQPEIAAYYRQLVGNAYGVTLEPYSADDD